LRPIPPEDVGATAADLDLGQGMDFYDIWGREELTHSRLRSSTRSGAATGSGTGQLCRLFRQAEGEKKRSEKASRTDLRPAGIRLGRRQPRSAGQAKARAKRRPKAPGREVASDQLIGVLGIALLATNP
jgi:phage tail tape-measure protein